MWDLPRPVIEPMSPAFQGRFLATGPLGKPRRLLRKLNMTSDFEVLRHRENNFTSTCDKEREWSGVPSTVRDYPSLSKPNGSALQGKAESSFMSFSLRSGGKLTIKIQCRRQEDVFVCACVY